MSRHKDGYTKTRLERAKSGEIIEQARFDRNLSIGQVAIKSKLHDSTIRHIEANGVLKTRVVSLLSLCKALDLDPMELIEADTGYHYE